MTYQLFFPEDYTAKKCGLELEVFRLLRRRGRFVYPDRIFNGRPFWTQHSIDAWNRGQREVLTRQAKAPGGKP